MMEDCRKSDIYYDEKSCRPTLLSFQNGKLMDGKESDLMCNIYENKKGEFTTAVASNKLLYTGEIKREDDLYNNFIAVRNRKTNKMTLIAVDNVVLKVQPSNSREILDSTMMTEKTTALTELNKQFGSKKTKRATEQMERLKLNAETVREQLEETVADIKINENDILSATNELTPSYMPPINREATVIENVYKLKKLVPSDVLKSLSEESTRLLEGTEDDINTSAYVKTEMIKLQSSPSDKKLDTANILMFVDCLISMISKTSKQMSPKTYQACTYSQLANSFLLNNFMITSGKNRLRPTTMRDKSIAYALVLALIAGKYQLNLGEICSDVKCGLNKVQEFARILSFHVTKQTAVIAELKFPLPPPLSNKKSPKKHK